METLIQLILTVALCKYCLKAALTGSYKLMVAYAAFMAIIAFALYPIIIQQPTTIITDILASKEIVENIALLTSLEAIIGISSSIYLINNYFKPKAERTKAAIFFKVVPGLLSIIGITYYELLFFKTRVGYDFVDTAIIYAIIVAAAILLISSIIKNTLRGESIKLEIKVIFNITILITGLLISSSVADYSISHAQTTIEWEALIAATTASILLITFGYYSFKNNLNSKIKELTNNILRKNRHGINN